jgi:phosphatidylserine/phosphatidylglycerophosphate/cardiolipin synthase-like enzyme
VSEIPRDDMVLGLFLNRLIKAQPSLDIRILIWKMPLAIAAEHDFFPLRSRSWLDKAIRFHLDDTAPNGASRHEKLLVVDDALAFCGGSDFGRDRLDIKSHPDRPRWRAMPDGARYPPRHDVMLCVEGEVAQVLGAHARARWQEATGEAVQPPPPRAPASLWPTGLAAQFEQIPIGVVRAVPAAPKHPAVRQGERLYLEAIGRARDVIYLENQYFTVPSVREALAARLREPDGPQIVMICTFKAPSYFDRATMDSARDLFVTRLKACDPYDRLRVYAPHTARGRPIIVHSKMAIFDDTLLRIGSSNLNNRSCGYDTELDIAIEGAPGIAPLRDAAIGHFIGWTGAEFAAHASRHPTLIAALDALGPAGARLKPYDPKPVGPLGRLISAWHLGDPYDVAEAWRPWRRQKDVILISSAKGK